MTQFEIMKEAAAQQKNAHFLLFHGGGVAQRRQAFWELACLLNCAAPKDGTECGLCPSCRKIMTGNHPDLHYVAPLKNSVGIDQILQLQTKLNRRRYEGNYRVCLIEDGDKLTLAAANALLKLAEEPPEYTVLVMSANNGESLLPTLRSRAQMIFFPALGRGEWTENPEAFQIGGEDPNLASEVEKIGVTEVREWLESYERMLEKEDFLLGMPLFSRLDKEQATIFLQVLAVWLREEIRCGRRRPSLLIELNKSLQALQKQANQRLVLEVTALRHLKQGGKSIG